MITLAVCFQKNIFHFFTSKIWTGGQTHSNYSHTLLIHLWITPENYIVISLIEIQISNCLKSLSLSYVLQIFVCPSVSSCSLSNITSHWNFKIKMHFSWKCQPLICKCDQLKKWTGNFYLTFNMDRRNIQVAFCGSWANTVTDMRTVMKFRTTVTNFCQTIRKYEKNVKNA